MQSSKVLLNALFLSKPQDIALDYSIVAESFETSVPWSNVFNLCENTKLRVANECRGRLV